MHGKFVWNRGQHLQCRIAPLGLPLSANRYAHAQSSRLVPFEAKIKLMHIRVYLGARVAIFFSFFSRPAHCTDALFGLVMPSFAPSASNLEFYSTVKLNALQTRRCIQAMCIMLL